MSGLVHHVPWPVAAAHALADLILRSWVLLENHDPGNFRVKPKMHLLLHLMSSTCCTLGPPASLWNYSEEDWGGKMARIAKRRGGADNPGPVALALLDRAVALM